MKFTTPRLRLTTRSETGEVSVVGDFADGERGRMAAEKAFSSADGSVFLDRVFTNGATQALVRVPQNGDRAHLTWEAAHADESERAMHLLSGCAQPFIRTPPLTRLEQLAENAGTTQDRPLGVQQRHVQLAELREQVETETQRRALGEIAQASRPQDDLADPEEVMARQSRGRRM